MATTIYGDSILKGVRLENGCYTVDRQWTARLEAIFGEGLVNRSRFGCTISKAMAVIRRDGKASYGPDDYAVLEFGGNDCDYNWSDISAAPEKTHLCKTPPEDFVRQYEEAVDLVRESGRTPVILTLPPIDSEKYLRFICRDGLSRENILTWLGDVDAIYRWQEKYSYLVEDIARRKNVRLLDLRKGFSENGAEELLCEDGIHPSRAGQERICRMLCAGVA